MTSEPLRASTSPPDNVCSKPRRSRRLPRVRPRPRRTCQFVRNGSPAWGVETGGADRRAQISPAVLNVVAAPETERPKGFLSTAVGG